MAENIIQAEQTPVSTDASRGGPTSTDSIESWSQLSLHAYIRALVIAILLYFLFSKETTDIVSRWFNDASWSHGILIPFFSIYFLNQTKKEILNHRAKPSYWGLFLLVCVILFYVFNTVSPSGYGYFRQISIIGALVAVVLFLGGWYLLKYTWLPVTYLVFAVPLPDYAIKPVTIPMSIWASTAATAILNLVPRLEATANGVIIEIVYKNVPLQPGLEVAEACSGIRLLTTFLALGVAMAYLHYRPIWQRLTLLASTIPIAITCNIVRVIITGLIHVLIDPQYAQGIYHDLLGMVMLPLAFGLYGCLAWFMSNLFIESEEDKAADIVIARQNRGESPT
ncbi:MAG: exosortase/archaeosortase family protein [Sedimentisphaerales bacterium]|nr:exosortase/archaeosortase family protein [Sedimentisphaerales bacterium]